MFTGIYIFRGITMIGSALNNNCWQLKLSKQQLFYNSKQLRANLKLVALLFTLSWQFAAFSHRCCTMSGHRHDAMQANQNLGNSLGARSAVRQTKFFRMYESGNTMKAWLAAGSCLGPKPLEVKRIVVWVLFGISGVSGIREMPIRYPETSLEDDNLSCLQFLYPQLLGKHH